jgi:hypothetical protein
MRFVTTPENIYNSSTLHINRSSKILDKNVSKEGSIWAGSHGGSNAGKSSQYQ